MNTYGKQYRSVSNSVMDTAAEQMDLLHDIPITCNHTRCRCGKENMEKTRHYLVMALFISWTVIIVFMIIFLLFQT